MNWTRGYNLAGKYTIIRVLGEGGFGITYLATNNDNGNKVAIKTLNSQMQNHRDFDKFQQYLLEESRILEKCQHYHIVKFYGRIKQGNLWCIVMEYIEGESLDKTIKNQGVLSEDQAITYIQQIGNALIEIHNQGILHRDVKPENIIKRQNQDEVVLIDFGIAREFNINQTQTHTQFLSDGFAPPEQYFIRRKRGNCTDIYALAATLYVMLTGYDNRGRHYLKRSIDREDEINQNKPDPLKSPQQKNSNISDEINQAILWGMKINYQERPKSVDQWLESLTTNNNYSSQHKTHSVYFSHISQKTYTNLSKILLGEKWRGIGIAGILIFLIFIAPLIFPCVGYICHPGTGPKEINYEQLEKFLKSKKFKEADQETWNIIFSLSNKNKDSWLNPEDVKNLSCDNFNTINGLWNQYSQGKFGFKKQSKIWLNLGGEPGIFEKKDEKLAKSFRNSVGWDNKNINEGYFPFLSTSRIYEFGAPYIAEKVQICDK